MDIEWARLLRDQCDGAGVPFFFKQWGEWSPRDGDIEPKRLGKAASGRLLDGRLWDQFPGVAI
jgi:protein gp37